MRIYDHICSAAAFVRHLFSLNVDLHDATSLDVTTINVATLNVKFDKDQNSLVPIPHHGGVSHSDECASKGKYTEHRWAERRSRIVDALLSGGPLDVIGFQEVYYTQLLDLSQLLGSTYGYVGVGRDDGKEAGEYSPIIYDRTRFELVSRQTKWLSKTPDVPGSVSWDAGMTRIATFVSLRQLGTDKLVHVVNTHYDDRGENARAESSLLIRELIHDWVQKVESEKHAKPGPVILLGDMNSPPSEEGYKHLTSFEPLPSHKPSFAFLDAYTKLETRFRFSNNSGPRQSAPFGPEHTYTGFEAPGYWNEKREDFVMLGAEISESGAVSEVASGEKGPSRKQVGSIGRGGWVITRYACQNNFVEREQGGWTGMLSDHRIVRATIELT